MLGRNRELRRLATCFVAVTLAGAGLSWRFVSARAGVCVLACSAALALVVGLFTAARYRELGRMARAVDAVLHGGRELDLDGMSEGELSMLSSEVAKMASRLTRTADDLARETAALSDSLADISHQLKTPLTSSALLCDLMRHRLLESPEGLDAEGVRELVGRLRTMRQIQDQVQWLVAALLRLARIDAGVVHLASGPVDACELARRAADDLAVAFELKGVELDLSLEPGAGFHGDASWSLEALTNVLKNCMEHTPAGGIVRLSVAEDALACRICVEDSGPGIAEADLPHVFERFYRSDDAGGASSEVDPTGVGIGLALARSLVVAQGGTIEAGNVEGEGGAVLGARFRIMFFKVVV